MQPTVFLTAPQIMQRIYSSQGPRDDWGNQGGQQFKILHAGSFNLEIAYKEFKKMCAELSLPKPKHIEREEHEGSIKHYVALYLTNEQWEEIRPIRNFCMPYSKPEDLERTIEAMSDQAELSDVERAARKAYLTIMSAMTHFVDI